MTANPDVPDNGPASAVPDSPAARRRRVAIAGHSGDTNTARAALTDPEPAVRATALGALERLGVLTTVELAAAAGDPEPVVRRRAALVLARHRDDALVLDLLDDDVAAVVEAACYAAGEHPPVTGATDAVVSRLIELARTHDDALVREAAIAALGAIGDPAGLPAILAGTHDRPAVRRRAVLALAPFDGPEVDAALRRALGDRDWQVRQAAEDLLDAGGSS